MHNGVFPAILIRPAVSADADGIARTYLESAAHHAGLDPERYAVPDLETITARYREGRQHSWQAGDGGSTFVAEHQGQVVGFVDAQLERSPDPMHRAMLYCHIVEIAVSSRHQSQGIGQKLVRAAEDWGRSHGATFASLEYHSANTRAGSFYRDRMGYRVASLTAIRRL